jgi:hypothetical protein
MPFIGQGRLVAGHHGNQRSGAQADRIALASGRSFEDQFSKLDFDALRSQMRWQRGGRFLQHQAH